ncbi:rhodanese-like domain-containing protein [Desnuesiella massiliensis]|uniref:rhodanese-like domain-containing protein n=1 Tax=Desnuesiella massiliensis TaxID=1650662 RepID=UPI0006E226FE|nr:rhodanese-like domain-containing protein [Desnuesiella massiliensis]
MFSFFNRNSVKSVNVNELDKLFGKINLIDIREIYEYRSGHVPTAKNIPMDKIIPECDKYLDKSKEYYLICQSGARSSRTCNYLKSKGFNVINVSGGTSGYRGALER